MGKPLLTTGPPDQDAVSREPPRWAPTVVVVVVLAVVIAAPLTLRALSPGDHGRIGFFERVVYEEDLDGDDAVVAGMIAPEGWYWSDGSGEGSFHTGDGAVEVTSELIADVPDPSAALTERVPAGADLVPPEGPVSREDGMTQYSLEDPLGSSGGPAENYLVCADSEELSFDTEKSPDSSTDCLYIGVEFSAADLDQAEADSIRAEVDDMIETIEVVR